ncbi:hypothetical protein [Fulvimarina endophytica]|uniref:hypothetical protein n=1 Tax=Fulvimarina endophytica TaxID=2293836 RepID=UPI0018F474CA|nr:hypothetical protein [Fulvimarina endophytica]
MTIEDDRELQELVASAMKSLSVAPTRRLPLDLATVKREEASLEKLISSLVTTAPRRPRPGQPTDRE